MGHFRWSSGDGPRPTPIRTPPMRPTAASWPRRRWPTNGRRSRGWRWWPTHHTKQGVSSPNKNVDAFLLGNYGTPVGMEKGQCFFTFRFGGQVLFGSAIRFWATFSSRFFGWFRFWRDGTYVFLEPSHLPWRLPWITFWAEFSVHP